jgi:hypothetical protein
MKIKFLPSKKSIILKLASIKKKFSLNQSILTIFIITEGILYPRLGGA